jgi:hypothetical protein
MKKVLSLVAGSVFVLAFGMAYADDIQPGGMDNSGDMIRNDDLDKYRSDQGQGTFNIAPVLPDEIGSAPGGVSGDTDSTWKNDTKEKPAPVEKDITRPTDKQGGMDSPSKGMEPYRY